MNRLEVGLELESGRPFELNVPGIAAHTAIFAQTGAGKSFLLGRYLEEVLLKTRAKVLVLDPNSDFLKFALPSNSGADPGFASRWQSIQAVVLTNRDEEALSRSRGQSIRRVVLDWSSLTTTEQCRYLNFVSPLDYQEYITVELANRVARAGAAVFTLPQFLATLRTMRDYLRARNAGDSSSASTLPSDIDWNLLPEQSLLKVFTEAFKLSELEFWPETPGDPTVDEIVHDFSSPGSRQRVLIADLPSLDHDQAQAMLADRVLELIWRNARTNWLDAVLRPADEDPRVPTFIVIDEAHNLVPPETSGAIEESVKARLTRIAAEGRKYGLFLILVTQRPSRLSSDVLSQVENLFLLKLTNRIDLEFIQQAFGTLEPAAVRKAATLEQGQFILSGRLATQVALLKGLPRRTEEGGRSIRSAAWIRPPEALKSA
jgi:hypothetical protein